MAARVTELEEQAILLCGEIYVLRPRQYFDRPTPDALCYAWNVAARSTMQTAVALENLGDLLRAKAGISGPGPFAMFVRDDDEDALDESDVHT